MKREDVVRHTLDCCPFCLCKDLKRESPEDVTGVYSLCPVCGAVGGIDRRPDGTLYYYWTAGRYAPQELIDRDIAREAEGVTQ